ncbi:unnamed protein product, partial [marine sediment metagenome]
NKYIEDVLNQKRNQIKTITVISKESYIDLFKNSLDYFDVLEWKYNEICKKEDFILSRFDVKRKLYKNTINSNFLVLQRDKVAYIITGGSRQFIKSGIYYITKRLFPKVIIAYLTSREIYDLISYYSKYVDNKFFYKNEVRRRMFGVKQTDVGYMTGKRRKRLRLYDEAFRRANSQGLWIDKISLFSENYEYYFDLSRDGILSIRRGTFMDYYPLLLKIGDKYIERMNFYDLRRRANSGL